MQSTTLTRTELKTALKQYKQDGLTTIDLRSTTAAMQAEYDRLNPQTNDNDPKYAFVRVSGNKKTGPIPVTTSPKQSCPSTCPFIEKGCYAKYGPLNWKWSAISDPAATIERETEGKKVGLKSSNMLSFDELVDQIKALPAGQLWRHNEAGDLTEFRTNTIDTSKLRALTAANRKRNKRGFTYTHSYTNPLNIEPIKRANANGFTINLSANSVAEAASLKQQYPELPVVTVLPIDWEDNHKPVARVGDLKVMQCPATRTDSNWNSCSECGLCQIADRDYVIGFPAHGAAKKHVTNLVSA